MCYVRYRRQRYKYGKLGNENGFTLYNCDYAMPQRKRRNTGLVPVLKCALGRQMTTGFRAEPIDDPLTEQGRPQYSPVPSCFCASSAMAVCCFGQVWRVRRLRNSNCRETNNNNNNNKNENYICHEYNWIERKRKI